MNRMAISNIVDSMDRMDPRRSHEAPASIRLRDDMRRQTFATWAIGASVLGSTAAGLLWLLSVAP